MPTPKRQARGERTREAVADALLELIEAGDLKPTAPRIAERAGVSLRLVFHHFGDLEDLFALAAERQGARLIPTFRMVPCDGPVEDRVDALVAERTRLFERIDMVRRASLLMEPFSPTIAARLENARSLKRSQVAAVFASELDRLKKGEQRHAIAALSTVLSFSTWNELHRYQGLSSERTRSIMKNLLSATLRSLETIAAIAFALCLVACGGATQTAPTYHKDVRAIVEAKCAGCHVEGGIAPFTLSTYADLASKKSLVRDAVVSRTMPPWLAKPGCNEYKADRSLSEDEIETFRRWIDDGVVEGQDKDYDAPKEPRAVGLSRVDQRLEIAQPYTPITSPDEYRCFLLDWPETATKYITGFRAAPGNATIVHHVIAFLAAPDKVSLYQALDDADERPGYTCFGGPGATSMDRARWLGSWAPGSLGSDYPADTGLKILPGSKVILQVHYNTLSANSAPDQTAVEVKLDDSVVKEAIIQPWTNIGWVNNRTMDIPAGEPDVVHSWLFDPTPFMTQITQGTIPSGAFTIWAAGLHMHTRGTAAKLEVVRYDETRECLLDIPRWDFHWQGSYGFVNPTIFNPGDEMFLECHFDNTESKQPIVNGQRLPVADVNWGEGTTDEMCLGGIYITR